MKKARILLVIDSLLPTDELLRIGARLEHSPSVEMGVLLLVDPGDISPTSPYYDDVMDALQRQSYRYLGTVCQLLNTSQSSAFLRISRQADRMTALVAGNFEASCILLGAAPGGQRAPITAREFVEQLALLTPIPVIPLSEARRPQLNYPLCYN